MVRHNAEVLSISSHKVSKRYEIKDLKLIMLMFLHQGILEFSPSP